MPKFILKFILFFALIFHAFLIFFIVAPTSLLVSMCYGQIEPLEPESIPPSIVQLLENTPNELTLSPKLDKEAGLFRKLTFKILLLRRDHFMQQDERLAYDLKVLNFGDQIVGMNAAAEYYFQNPLSTISEAQWVMLLNWYEIFLK